MMSCTALRREVEEVELWVVRDWENNRLVDMKRAKFGEMRPLWRSVGDIILRSDGSEFGHAREVARGTVIKRR